MTPAQIEALPRVSDIIRPLVDFSMVREDALAYAADRGTAVHTACELWDVGDLDEDALDPVLCGYLAAWKAFTCDFRPRWVDIEAARFSAAIGVRGTPDRVGFMQETSCIVDIKSVSVLSPVTGVQLSGYELLAGPAELRIAVQLRPDGTYRHKSYSDERATFLSLLTLHNWRLRNGIR
jgi:hypothetical protein